MSLMVCSVFFRTCTSYMAVWRNLQHFHCFCL